MLVMMSCAKTMTDVSNVNTPLVTRPMFQSEASEIMMQMAQLKVEELEHALGVTSKLAIENFHRYQVFHAPETKELPALLAYTGIVFKHLNPEDFSKDDFSFAQQYLRLTSFGYGLLRPYDAIRPYRLEGNVRLPELGGDTMFAYWKGKLTDYFIQDIQRAGGILCYLASEEMKNLFDWKRVQREVQVVTPEFYVWKKGKPSTIVVYTKMARGEMARFIIKKRLSDPDSLKKFVWEGFSFNTELSTDERLVFLNGERQ